LRRWSKCKLCGLFRDCWVSVIPPRRFWQDMIDSSKGFVPQQRWICGECNSSFGHDFESYHRQQEAVYEGFQIQ